MCIATIEGHSDLISLYCISSKYLYKAWKITLQIDCVWLFMIVYDCDHYIVKFTKFEFWLCDCSKIGILIVRLCNCAWLCLIVLIVYDCVEYTERKNLPFFYATFQCGRYNVFKIFFFFFFPQKVEKIAPKSCILSAFGSF